MAVYVNFDEGVKRVVNNAKLYVKLITKMKGDCAGWIEDLKAKIAAKDFQNAQVVAHTIKGASANLSLTELNAQVLELETQIKAVNAGTAADINADQMAKVQSAYDETIKEIDKVIAEHA